MVGRGRGNEGGRRLRRALLAGVVACATLIGAAGASGATADPAPLGEIQLAPSSAGAKPFDKSVPPSAEGLSSRLVQLSTPRLATADNQRQAKAVDLPRFGGDSLQRDGRKLIVQARVEQTSDALIGSLRAVGAKVIFVSHRYMTVDLAIDEQRLRDLAGVSGVLSVRELLQPVVNKVGGAGGAGGAMPGIAPPCGGVISEGDEQLRAAEARSAYEVDGSGVKVGVISDSYDKSAQAATRASSDVGSGDLPGPGNPCSRTTSPQILSDTVATGSDEGRAMMQIVHDMAPGAELAFADSANSEEAFANQIRALDSAGSQVIVDDITYTAEPMYQDGPVSVAVNDVTARGRTYFSSAANSNVQLNGKNVGSFEAQSFRDSGACSDGNYSLAHCMDFDPGADTDNTFCFEQAPGNQFQVALQWAEPRNGVTTDFDMWLFEPAPGGGGQFVANAAENNLTSQMPFEAMQISNQTGAPKTYCIAIDKFAGGNNPRLKFILSRAKLTAVEYPDAQGTDVIGPSIYSHNGAANAVSTAAVPYNNSGTLEDYSSYGPVTLTHGPVTGSGAAAPLPAPQVLAKPDISATDNNRTTFFVPTGTPNEYRFGGTSAAAPHAAGIAALQLQANPNATPDQIKQAQYSTAAAVGSLPAEGRGAGLLNAVGAVGAVVPVTPPPPPSPPGLDLDLAARAKQKVKALQLSAICSNDCTLDVAAIGKATQKKKKKKKGGKKKGGKRQVVVARKKTKTIRFRSKATANLLAGTPTKVKLPLRGKKARQISKLDGKVTFRAVATDTYGQVTANSAKAKLKPKKKKGKKR